MSTITIVTLDGPAGVGKTTVARLVADQLDLAYLDTGAMFRAVAWRFG
ncbi:MAG: AAA family ATPase, partial [Desulfovibrionales bacterium]|nr:AAA family ATPase [Desulfovibrionales bacterium]